MTENKKEQEKEIQEVHNFMDKFYIEHGDLMELLMKYDDWDNKLTASKMQFLFAIKSPLTEFSFVPINDHFAKIYKYDSKRDLIHVINLFVEKT